MTTPGYPTRACVAGSQVHGEMPGSPASAFNVNLNNGNVNNNHRNNSGFGLACRRARESQGDANEGKITERQWLRGQRQDGEKIARFQRPASTGGRPAKCSEGGNTSGEGWHCYDVRGFESHLAQPSSGVQLRALYDAYQAARRGKQPSFDKLRFDAHFITGLLYIQQNLNAGMWSPAVSTSFVATRPKAREIHAPAFRDRVVHHWLVPQLEAIYEPRFIAHSYANRKGKGSHAAVRYARDCVRQVHSGQGGGWYLQLDIANFFNSVRRDKLWAMLKPVLQRARLPLEAQMAAHALLRGPALKAGVRQRATHEQLQLVPAHKRLTNAPRRCGLPIGNLSSQFLANVYLDALDQFVKHELKARRYLRYVDDFVLFHHDRAQLVEWQRRIEIFLADTLDLRLKDEVKLRRLSDGLDFLGYVIYPTHLRARRRVVSHLQEALAAWEGAHVRGRNLSGTPADFDHIRTVLASYAGHLQHAASHRLWKSLERRFPWITTAAVPRRFSHRLQGRHMTIKAAHEST